MSYNGWYQVAFERDLAEEIVPAEIATNRLVIVRTPGEVRAFDAVCPHRGAHLAFGGRLDREAIVCPFHGYRVGLSASAKKRFLAREYRTLVIGGLVFVRMSDAHENGLTELLEELDEDHYFVPGFAMRIQAPAEMVIENAFDQAHFRTVHGVGNEPEFVIRSSENGEHAVDGVFEIPTSPWQKSRENGMLRVPFTARAFSPGIVVSHLGGDDPYWIITAATPDAIGGCVVRLSLAVRAAADGSPPSTELCHYLLRQSKAGLEEDQTIWENMSTTMQPRFTAEDASVIGFREFCQRIRGEAGP